MPSMGDASPSSCPRLDLRRVLFAAALIYDFIRGVIRMRQGIELHIFPYVDVTSVDLFDHVSCPQALLLCRITVGYGQLISVEM